MSKRFNAIVLAVILGVSLMPGCTPKPPQPPNIIWIMADDLSWGDLGCYGQKLIKTPNIDKLAHGGMRFTQAYAGNSVCAPSRSCLMQGLHPGHATIRDNAFRRYRHSLTRKDTTVAMVLQQAGYRTGLFGKWGLALSAQPGTPNAKGFNEFFGYLDQRKAHSFYPQYLWHNRVPVPLPGNTGHTAPYAGPREYTPEGKLILHNVPDPEKAVYSFDLIAEKSRDFINQNAGQPFFLYLAHTLPHGPLITPDLAPYTKEDWPTIRHKEWAAMITRLDNEIGRIVGLVDSLDLTENTVIFFCSDNGYSAHGYFRGVQGPDFNEVFQNQGPTRGRKGNLYDGGLRVPMIAYWPGTIKAGAVSDHIWAFWDFFPTAAELAGARQAAVTDGISLVPTLLGNTADQPQHDYLYWEFRQAQALRMGNWYAHKANHARTELYDIISDPAQARDLAMDNPELIAKIEQIFAEEHEDNDVWPAPGETIEMYEKRRKSKGLGPLISNIDD